MRLLKKPLHILLLFVGCVTSQQHACVSQEWCCYTEIKVAEPIFNLTRSQYTDIGPTSPNADPVTPSAWQGGHRGTTFKVTVMTRPGKKPDPRQKRWESNPSLPLSRGTLDQRANDAVCIIEIHTKTIWVENESFFLCCVGCLTSQQHACASQGRVCSDNFTCCHTEIEVADQTFYLTQSQYTDTGPTSPSADPATPSAWQGRHRGTTFKVTGMTRPGKIPSQAGFEPRTFSSRGGRLSH